jgi:hypothetical protein
MQVREFAKPVTANKLNESMAARFGTKLSLTKFTLEQLQDARNRIRTQLSQVETNESFDSVQNETYQKSKMMLDVLNAAISERGGIDEGSKPDFLDIDKDGNKKEPMKKAVADKKKAPVKEGVALSPKYIKHLQLALRNKGPQLSRSETRELQNILDKLDIANIKTLMKADIPHLSQMAKNYIRTKTPGGMVRPLESVGDKKKKKIKEGAEDHAELVMAAKEMVDRVTSWMEDTAEMQTESMLELADAIRDEMGQAASDSFTGMIKPALDSLYQALDATRTSLNGGVSQLTGEGETPDMMGADDMGDMGDMEPPVDADADSIIDPTAGDEGDFGAAEPATGGDEPADRAKRESIQRIVKKVTKENVNGRKLVTSLSKKK